MEGDFISSNNPSNQVTENQITQVTQVTENQVTQASNESSNQAPQFPSGQVLLDTIRHEYDIESSRKRDFETRAGVLIALSGALIGFYASSLDYSAFKEASTPMEYIGATLLGILYLLPTITLLISLGNFLKILDTKSYDRIGLGGFNDEMGQKPSDEVALRLAKSYKSVIENNHTVNENKVKQFKTGINFMYISLISVIVVYCFKEIINLVL